MRISGSSRLRFALVGALLLCWLGLASVAAAQIEPQPHREDLDRQAREAHRTPVLTKAPELLAYVDPDYPAEIVELGLEGEVVLLLTLSAEGEVTAVEVTHSPHPSLSEAAEDAAWRLAFSPAEIDGERAPVQIEFGYVFTLDAISQDPTPLDAAGADDGPEGLNGVSREAPTIAKEPPVSLAGRALARGLREPVDAALVVSGELMATTDAAGYFELRLEPGRAHQVEVRAPGFHVFETVEHIEDGERHEVVYYLQRRGQSPFETVVRAQRPRKEVSRVVVTREETRRVPGTFGDPLRVIESLPGMARAPYIGGQLLVRGARPEDSGVYFDGTSIPLLYHFGGLTSVVNAEFIEEITFLPGGFGAEYGRATAGVVDVTPRRLLGQPARGAAKIDLMDTSVFYRHPIRDDLAVGFAFRRSYIDVILPVFINAAMRAAGEDDMRLTLTPVYGDYQVKVDWNPTREHELDLFVFGSQDTLDLLTSGSLQMHGLDVDMRLAFHRMLVSHTWRIRPDVVLRTRPFFGLTLQGAGGSEVDGPISVDADLALLEGGLRQDLTWRATEALTLRAGLDVLALRGRGNIDAPLPGDLLAFPSPMQPLSENQAFEVVSGGGAGALWAEAVIEPSSRLQLVPGLRTEVYRFPAATRPVLEPRLSTRLRLLDGTTFKAAAGLYHKAPTIFEINDVIGNPSLRPERARHLVAGVEQTLTDVLDLDLQVFHNSLTDLVVPGEAHELEDGQAVGETFVNEGDGRAYGMEVLLRHKLTNRAFGWLAYTLMRSERRRGPDRDYLLTAQDQTHILTLVGSYRVSSGFEVGARFRLVTGNPYTPIIDSTHDLDSDRWIPVEGETRSERLQTFHQLDLRAEYTHTFDTFQLAVFMDLLNAYNRRNVESFQYDYRYRERIDFSGLPLFPVLGVRGQW